MDTQPPQLPDAGLHAAFSTLRESLAAAIVGQSALVGRLLIALLADGHLQAPYVASQGINLDRSGIVNIAQDAAGQVWVGGHVSAGIRGEVLL